MTRTLDDALHWVETGTQLVHSAIEGLDEATAHTPSLLPGWTRKHLIAHLAANADAIANLVHWASTGEETQMYSSPGQRTEEIERGALLSLRELVSWFQRSSCALSHSMAGLVPDHWAAHVITAQGRQVMAAEIPWLRAREVMVHSIDLDTGVTFADLPATFLEALVEDVLAKRGPHTDVTGPLAERAAYLTGRTDGEIAGVQAPDGGPAPVLPPWL